MLYNDFPPFWFNQGLLGRRTFCLGSKALKLKSSFSAGLRESGWRAVRRFSKGKGKRKDKTPRLLKLRRCNQGIKTEWGNKNSSHWTVYSSVEIPCCSRIPLAFLLSTFSPRPEYKQLGINCWPLTPNVCGFNLSTVFYPMPYKHWTQKSVFLSTIFFRVNSRIDFKLMIWTGVQIS